jgi:hypothetical protein
MRGIMHWMAGLTLFWLLITTLWMPWIDYGKTYRGYRHVAGQPRCPRKRNCIASANVADSILASMDTLTASARSAGKSATGKRCELLLIHGSPKDGGALQATGGWRRDLGRRSSGRPS